MGMFGKKKGRVLSLILAVILALGSLPMSGFAVGAETGVHTGVETGTVIGTEIANEIDSDIEGHWARETLEMWNSRGWFNGDGEGIFRPDSGITRAEFMALVNRMKDYREPLEDMSKYADVSESQWYYAAVAVALNAGYISGTGDTTVSPESEITRQEAMTILARLAGVTEADTGILEAAADGEQVADWAEPTVAACIQEGLVAGSNGKINPTAKLTRAEAVVLLERSYSNMRMYGFAGTYGPLSGTASAGDVVIASPDVALNNMNISGNLTIDKAVGEGDVHLTKLHIKGDLYVEGGGQESLHLEDVRVDGSLIVQKTVGENKVRIVISGSSKIGVIILKTGAIIVTQELADGSIERIEISEDFRRGSTFEFVGDFDYIENNGRNANITISGSVNTLKLNAPARISGDGEITVLDADAQTTEDSRLGITPGTIIDSENAAGVDTGLPTTTTQPGTVGGGGGSGGGGTGGGGNTTPVTPQGAYITAIAPLTARVQQDAFYALPPEVSVDLSTGTARTLFVVWETAAAKTSEVGVFLHTGTVNLTGDIKNPNNLTAKLTLTVEPILEQIYITQNPAKLYYLVGEPMEIRGLIVKGIYSDGSIETMDVSTENISGFDSSSAGVITVTVTVGGKTDSFVLSVCEALTGTIVSVLEPREIIVENGAEMTNEGLNLPQSIQVMVFPIRAVEPQLTLAPVAWDLTTAPPQYNPSLKTEQSFLVNGIITLPAGITNDAVPPVSLEVQVFVTVQAVKYVVQFDLNGQYGPTIQKQFVDHEGVVAIPKVPITTELDFDAWFKEAACQTPWDFYMDVVTSDTTLFAKWKAKPVAVTTGRDVRFAQGYPMVSIDGIGTMRLQLKLAAEPTDPILAYVVAYGDFGEDILPSVQDVLHGHTGNGGRSVEDQIDYAEYSSAWLEDTEVVTILFYNLIEYSEENAQVGIVLSDGMNVSSEVTLITIKLEPESNNTEYPPYMIDGLINSQFDKIFIFFDESLDLTAIPPTLDFVIRDYNSENPLPGVAITSVNLYNNSTRFRWFGACAELSVSGITRQHIDEGIYILYTPSPQSKAITSERGFAMSIEIDEYFRSGMISVLDQGVPQGYINPAGGSAYVRLDMGFSIKHGARDFADAIIIKHNGVPIPLTGKFSYDFYSDSAEVVLQFDPLPSTGSFTWSFEPSAPMYDLAMQPVASIINRSFDEQYSGNPTDFTADFIKSDNVDYYSLILIEFKNCKMWNSTYSACNFILTIDGKEYPIRGFRCFTNYNEVRGITQCRVYLEDILSDIVARANVVTIRYQDSHGLFNGDFTEQILRDKAGTAVPAFGPIPVETIVG